MEDRNRSSWTLTMILWSDKSSTNTITGTWLIWTEISSSTSIIQTRSRKLTDWRKLEHSRWLDLEATLGPLTTKIRLQKWKSRSRREVEEVWIGIETLVMKVWPLAPKLDKSLRKLLTWAWGKERSFWRIFSNGSFMEVFKVLMGNFCTIWCFRFP